MHSVDPVSGERLCFMPETAARLKTSRMSIIVTGAGGWLGQAALEMFDSVFGDAMPKRVSAFARTSRTISLRSGRSILCRGLDVLDQSKAREPLILHCAFLTREHVNKLSSEAYIAATRNISRTVYLAIERNGASGLFLPSSGAVYRADRTPDKDLTGNPYGSLKYEDELAFSDLASRWDFPAAIIRIFNLAGPFINKLDSYALASILRDIARGGPIVLKATRPVWRSYAHVANVLDLAVSMILSGIKSPPFDTAGDVEIEIEDLAKRAAQVLGAPNIIIRRPAIGSIEADRYVGDGADYVDLARRISLPLKPLDLQIRDTAAYLEQIL